MQLSETVKTPGDMPATSGTPVGASLPYAEFWMALVFLTMTIRGITLWELGDGQAHGRIGDMVLLIVFGLWFGARCLLGTFGIVRNRLDLAVMLFVMFYLASILWAHNLEAGGLRLLKLLRNWMLYILLADYLCGNFLRRYRKIALYIMLSGLVLSIAFVVSISRHGGAAALATLLQAEAIASSNPLLFVVRSDQGAGLLMMGFASWLPLCMFIGLSIQPWVRSRMALWGNWIYFFLMGAMTLLSASRAAVVGLAAGFTCIVPLVAPTITLKKIMGGTIITAAVIVALSQSGLYSFIMARFSPEVIEKDDAIAARLEFYEYTLDRFKESPLIGMGVASIDPEGLMDSGHFLIVHNVYLQVLGELGIAGGSLFLWIMILWMWYLLCAYKRASNIQNPGVQRIAICLSGYSIFLFTFFLVGHDLGSAEPWIVMGIASALYNEGDRYLSSPARINC